MVAAVMLPLCAISVDIARMYVEAQRLQNAADAASMAGVTFLPDDFATAKSTAITVSGRNGFPNSGKTSVTVALGAKPTQLKVTVSSTIYNSFAASFNKSWATVSRSSSGRLQRPGPDGQPVQRVRQRAGSRRGGSRSAPAARSSRPRVGAAMYDEPAVLGSHRRPGHPEGQRRPGHDPQVPRRRGRVQRHHEHRLRPAGLLLHRARRERERSGSRWASRSTTRRSSRPATTASSRRTTPTVRRAPSSART